jgi:hypothetical protein
MTNSFSVSADWIPEFGSWATALPANLDERQGVALVAAGAAAALAVALAMAVYLRSGYPTSSDLMQHGLATIVVLGLLAFVAYDMRHEAFDYLGINPSKPAVGIETRRPTATVLAANTREIQHRLHHVI